MLSIYQKKFLKSHNRKDLLSSRFSDKCKKDFPQILASHGKFRKVNRLLNVHGHFFLGPHLYQACFVSNFIVSNFKMSDSYLGVQSTLLVSADFCL